MNALRTLFNLNARRTNYLLKEMSQTALHEGHELSVMSRGLNITPSKLAEYLPYFAEVVLRILQGKGTAEVQQDLVKNGFPRLNVKLLFSKVNGFPPRVKGAVRYWAMEGETHDDRNHIHYFRHGPDVRTMVDNGSIIAILPTSRIKIRTSKDKSDWDLELDLRELSYLISALETARQKMEKATTGFKRKLGKTVLSPVTAG